MDDEANELSNETDLFPFLREIESWNEVFNNLLKNKILLLKIGLIKFSFIQSKKLLKKNHGRSII